MIEFAAFLAFVAALGVFLMISRRTVSAALVFATLSIAVATGLVEMKSRPKPVNLEWRSVDWAEVLWYALVEHSAIYFVLEMPGGPSFYVMPWDGARAEELLKAGRKARGTGAKLRMGRPFEPSLAPNERLFYAAPQPAPPPKD